MLHRFFQVDLSIVLTALLVNYSLASPGPASPGTAIAEYNWQTGEITVSLDSVVNWYVESASSSLTGAEPNGLTGANGLVTDHHKRIGESPVFSSISYINHNLGAVAATGLPIRPDRTIPDLSIWWNASLGSPTQNQPVFLAADGAPDNFAPIADISGPYVDYLFSKPTSLILDASESLDDGPDSSLNYLWDLDNDLDFEVSTGNSPYLEIQDVSGTFGESGIYDIAVKVFDGEYSDIAHTTVQPIPNRPPAYADYDPLTGQIVVSVENVRYWYIHSKSAGLTGYPPAESPAGGNVHGGAGGGPNTRNSSIGEVGRNFSYEDFNLGEVAEVGLPKGDLTIYWNDGTGPNVIMPVNYLRRISENVVEVPEVPTASLLVIGLSFLAYCRMNR